MTTDTTATPTGDAPSVEAVAARLDDFGRMAVDRLVGQVNERNANLDRLNSIGGDRVTRLDSMREALTSGEGDTALVNLQKQIQTLLDKVGDLTEQRDKALNAQIDAEIATSDVDPKALEEQIKVQDNSIRQGTTYLVGLYGETVKVLLPEVKSRRGGSRATNGGSGKRRLRGFDVYVNDVICTSPDKDGKQRSSFSAAAKVIGLDSVDPLSEAYREAFGNDPDNFPPTGEFTFTHGEDTFKVRAVRQEK
jgi:hypothetical protein